MTTAYALASVAIGGALGAVSRYLCVGLAARLFGHGFPIGTMIVNVLGSVAMGIVAVVLLERASLSPPSNEGSAQMSAWARFAPFAITGVLGGFTTFSAFSLDALYLIERGRLGAATAYVVGSVALSVLGLWLGMSLMRRVV